MKKIFNGIKTLVTAGPTWAPIDDVRVITNIFGGTTGYRIALLAAQMGADVTLLLGPYRIKETNITVSESFRDIAGKVKNIIHAKLDIFLSKGNLKIIHYTYFDELMNLMRENISAKKYRVVIHSAAISDYIPTKLKGKIASGSSELAIKLEPTEKIIKYIKQWDSEIFLAQFKLEVGLTEAELLERAYNSLIKNNSDLVVANNKFHTSDTTAAAYFIDSANNVIKVWSREEMYKRLLIEINKRI